MKEKSGLSKFLDLCVEEIPEELEEALIVAKKSMDEYKKIVLQKAKKGGVNEENLDNYIDAITDDTVREKVYEKFLTPKQKEEMKKFNIKIDGYMKKLDKILENRSLINSIDTSVDVEIEKSENIIRLEKKQVEFELLQASVMELVKKSKEAQNKLEAIRFKQMALQKNKELIQCRKELSQLIARDIVLDKVLQRMNDKTQKDANKIDGIKSFASSTKR